MHITNRPTCFRIGLSGVCAEACRSTRGRGEADLWIHVIFDDKIVVGIEIDVSAELVIALHHVSEVQLQFDVRVHFACIHQMNTQQTSATLFLVELRT